VTAALDGVPTGTVDRGRHLLAAARAALGGTRSATEGEVVDPLTLGRRCGAAAQGQGVDLTSMWAGPLATRLLAEAGAEVDTIEAACRPDGLRGTPAMFDHLAEGKRRHDLDLRGADARAALVDLVADADVVVESFSPRVMPNFGLDAATLVAVNPEILVVSMPAFAPGTAEPDWVAYGTGVHAHAGLGIGADGVAWAPADTYPDPLAGLATFAAICIARAAGVRGRHLVVPLEAALERFGPLTVHIDFGDDGVATVTLARPDKLNVIDVATRDELIGAFTAVRDAPDARAALGRAGDREPRRGPAARRARSAGRPQRQAGPALRRRPTPRRRPERGEAPGPIGRRSAGVTRGRTGSRPSDDSFPNANIA